MNGIANSKKGMRPLLLQRYRSLIVPIIVFIMKFIALGTVVMNVEIRMFGVPLI